MKYLLTHLSIIGRCQPMQQDFCSHLNNNSVPFCPKNISDGNIHENREHFLASAGGRACRKK